MAKRVAVKPTRVAVKDAPPKRVAVRDDADDAIACGGFPKPETTDGESAAALTVVDIPRPTVPFPALDEDGYRTCARVECGAHFKPKQLSRAFCSTECTVLAFGKRHGMTFTTITVEGAEGDAEKDALKTQRLGPMRDVAETIGEPGPRSKKVRFDCGHEQTVPLNAERMRCRACRKGATETVAMVAAPAKKSKRTAVTDDDAIGVEIAESASVVKSERRTAVKERDDVKRDDDDALAAKYGPQRKIVEHLGSRGARGGHHVKLDCGHEVGAKPGMSQKRCSACLKGTPAPTEGRVDVAKRAKPAAKKPAKRHQCGRKCFDRGKCWITNKPVQRRRK